MRLVTKACVVLVSPDPAGPWTPFPDLAITPTQRSKLNEPFVVHQLANRLLCRRMKRTFVRQICRSTGRFPADLIDSKVDLCSVGYSVFRHNPWILEKQGELDANFRSKFSKSSDYLDKSDLFAFAGLSPTPGGVAKEADDESEDQ